MPKQRSTILSYLTLILAAAALINSMLPKSPIAFGASNHQNRADAVGQPNQSIVAAQANAQGTLTLEGAAVAATVPTYIGYQGVLRDGEGKPITGQVNVTFRIYDDVGAPLNNTECKPENSPCKWGETQQNITVRDGRFSVLLGNSKPPTSTIPVSIFTNPNRFIGVQVDGYQEMLPRQKFSSVPYAMWAERAATAIRADSAGNADTAGRAGTAGRADTLVPNAVIDGGGLQVQNTNWDGYRVINAGASGVYVENPNEGFFSARARNRGLVIVDSGGSGIDVLNSGGFGLYIDGTRDWGIQVLNTTEYAAAFFGNVLVNGYCISCGQAVFGLNTSQQPLELGDIVSVRGITASELQAQPLLDVSLTTNADTIFGVVVSRAEVSSPKSAPNSTQTQVRKAIVPKAGNAQPGDYVTIVTSGMAQVKTNGVSSMKSGTPLTIGAQPGMAQTMEASTQALTNTAIRPSIVGTALENAQPGQKRVWVLVNPR